MPCPRQTETKGRPDPEVSSASRPWGSRREANTSLPHHRLDGPLGHQLLTHLVTCALTLALARLLLPTPRSVPVPMQSTPQCGGRQAPSLQASGQMSPTRPSPTTGQSCQPRTIHGPPVGASHLVYCGLPSVTPHPWAVSPPQGPTSVLLAVTFPPPGRMHSRCMGARRMHLRILKTEEGDCHLQEQGTLLAHRAHPSKRQGWA